ncbi:MAG: ACP S-malonyltransferase, partial [Nitrospira sp.]|nr:ACP S-malonyltransferase [Nitrospira sp.]
TFDQLVIAGTADAVNKAMELAKEKGAKKIVPLNVSVPSHTQLMKVSSERFAEILDTVKFSDIKTPLITNVDAKIVNLLSDIKDSLIRQLTSPVRWCESMSTLINMGYDTFIEVGPGRVLSGLIRKIARDLDVKTDIMNIEDYDSFKKTLEVIKA